MRTVILIGLILIAEAINPKHMIYLGDKVGWFIGLILGIVIAMDIADYLIKLTKR